MKLIILRHGRTEENDAGIFQGQLPGKLSAEGKAQALRSAERLKKEKIDKIIVSDLARTKDTAEPIIKTHPESKVIYEKRIMEINHGICEGRRHFECKDIIEKQMRDHDYKFSGGESTRLLYDRVSGFIEELLKNSKNKTVLLVTHGEVIKSIISYFIYHSLDKARDEYHKHFFKNASLTYINIDEKGNHEIKIYDSTEHLD